MVKKKKNLLLGDNENNEKESINIIEDDYTKDSLEDEKIDLNVDDIDIIDETVIEIEDDFDIIFKSNANKHKLDGKHSLKRDVIFKGKLEEEKEDDGFTEIYPSDNQCNNDYDSDNYDIKADSQFEIEIMHNEDYHYKKDLAKDIYDLLSNKTDLDFSVNRRKPNRQIFNNYYEICISKLNDKFSKSEIFVELSYYFTDNIFNMFKLLEKKNAAGIILELKDRGFLKDIGNINFV